MNLYIYIYTKDSERSSKKLRKVFNRFDLKITIDSNLVRNDFVDVELTLRNDTYAPYGKPNFQATCVNVQSNLPRYIFNQVSKSINNMLKILSKNESSFNKAKQHYQEGTGLNCTKLLNCTKPKLHEVTKLLEDNFAPRVNFARSVIFARVYKKRTEKELKDKFIKKQKKSY